MHYLYYRRNDEWVRVQADSYERQYQSDPTYFTGGQCVAEYSVIFTVDQYTSAGVYVNTLIDRALGQFADGPISDVSLTDANKRVRVYDRLGSKVFQLTNSNNYMLNLRNVKVSRRNGVADNCGNTAGSTTGDCSTVFKLASGATVLTLPSCPEITDGKGCSECCRELLPLARSIAI
jgi:hypothetical protein